MFVIRRCIFLLALVLFVSVNLSAQNSLKRKIPCETPNNEKSCFWTHGRLTFGNGTPAFRLWQVGTKHLLGIYSSPSVDRHSLDNENPEFMRWLVALLGWFSQRSARLFVQPDGNQPIRRTPGAWSDPLRELQAAACS